MSSVEYRVRPVVRYVVTRYNHASEESGLPSFSEALGEFDNEGFAEEAAAAFRARTSESERLSAHIKMEREAHSERCGYSEASASIRSRSNGLT